MDKRTNKGRFTKGWIPWNRGHREYPYTCEECKKIFGSVYPGRKFCSKKCYHANRGKTTKVQCNCYLCGKVFSTPGFTWRWKTRLKKKMFCSRKCLFKWRKTPDSPSWKGGKSFEPYGREFWALRELIRQRDNYTCQLCGVPQIECVRKLDVHHIDYNKKNTNRNNLIALCQGCNSHVNTNRKYWTEYFQNKVNVNF